MSHDSHHDHPDFLAHHFETPKQQFEAGKLGMWLFLATEVLLFGGLFCGYAVWRGNHPELFKYGSQFLDVKWGAINTGVLILSSLTMAWAVTAAQQNKKQLLIVLLGLTLCGAAGFMGIKYIEYTHKFADGIYPGMRFYEGPADPANAHLWVAPGHDDAGDHGEAHDDGHETDAAPAALVTGGSPLPEAEASVVPLAPAGPRGIDLAEIIAGEVKEHEASHGDHPLHPLQDGERPRSAHMFFNIYFMMTGLHGIHVIIGAIVIGWLLRRAVKGDFSNEYFTPVDLGGLYWHVVDLIWIFLFPLFYLI